MKRYIIQVMLVVMITTSPLNSQINRSKKYKSIPSELTVLVNGNTVKDHNSAICIRNKTLNTENEIITGGSAQLVFDYNTEYELSICRPGCNTKIIEINTNAPRDNWYINASVSLSDKNSRKIKAGKISYDKKHKRFKAKTFNK